MKLKTEYRYPLFFTGIMIMALSGFVGKYFPKTEIYVSYFVIFGFLMMIFSVAFP